jgi:hypothetical protein
VIKSDALVASDVCGRLATKLVLYLSGSPIDNNGSLASLLKLGKKADRMKAPLVTIVHKDDIRQLVIRLPSVDLSDGLIVDNISLLFNFIRILLKVDIENFRVVKDSDLGTDIVLNKYHIDLMETLSSSAEHPSGLFLGEFYKFETGFSGNLPCLLAAMRYLSTYKNFLRPRPKGLKEVKAVRVNYSDLQTTFNMKSGLHKKEDYTSLLIRNVLRILVNPTNKIFPGGWNNSVKVSNGAKAVVGLLYKMGWVERVPLKSKVLSVLYTDVETDSKGKKALKNHSEKGYNLGYAAFRTGLALLLPMIDPSSSEEMEIQIGRDPLKISNPKIIEAYSNIPHAKLIDQLSYTNAVRLSCSAKSTKSKPIHYEMARNNLLHRSDKVEYKDANGKIYHSLEDIPKSTLDFLRKKLSYPVKKRQAENDKPIEGESSKAQAPKRAKAVHKKFSELPVYNLIFINVLR